MKKHQVIIIGAGISGLAAALELIENGVNNIVLLEAQNRIGGRIHSVPMDKDKSYEFGAQWVHAHQKNPVYDLCETLKLLDSKRDSKSSKNISYATQNATAIDKNYVHEIMHDIDGIFDEVDEKSKEKTDDMSLLSKMIKKFNMYAENKIKKDNYDINQVAILDAIFDATLKEEKINMACESLNDLSLLGWASYEKCVNKNMMNLKNGFWKLLQYLLGQISLDKIKFNQEVLKVFWPDDTPQDLDSKKLSDQIITIITKDIATGQELMYFTNYCICTMPLGVLKAKHRDIFAPNLNSHRIHAIERLGVGTLNKIYIVFEKQIFNEGEPNNLQVLWRKDVNLSLKAAAKKWVFQKPKFYESFLCFELLPKSNNILYTYISGDDAVYIEELNDQCLIDVFGELLAFCFPKIKFPKIIGLQRSYWHSNPYIRGSHSYIKIGSSVNDIIELRKPLNNKVFFAGEATSYKYGSTLHGAYESGVAQAENIIKIIENRKK